MLNPIGFPMKIARRGGVSRSIVLLVLVAVCFFALCPEADAAPGGQFVKQLLSSKYGRIGGLIVGVLMLAVFILLLPLILFVIYKEAAGIRQTKKDLAALAEKYSWFAWSGIRDRVSQAVRKIAEVWASGNLSTVASFMTPDYFTSQQQLLKRWVDEGKQIVYRLDKVRSIEPLAVHVEDEECHSWIRVLVSVDCVDYMRDEYTKEVIKGDISKSEGFKTVWVFVCRDRNWLLAGIEEGSTSLTWAMEKNHVDTGYLDAVRAQKRQRNPKHADGSVRSAGKSQSAALDLPTNESTTQPKQRLIRKPADDQQQ